MRSKMSKFSGVVHSPSKSLLPGMEKLLLRGSLVRCYEVASARGRVRCPLKNQPLIFFGSKSETSCGSLAGLACELVVLGTRLNPLSAQGIVARGFRNRGGSLSRGSRPDSVPEGESEAKRKGRRAAIARFYRAIRARGIRNRHSLATHVVLGTSEGPAEGGGSPWY